MSILQEYNEHERILGQKRLLAIDEYIDLNDKAISCSDIVYNPHEFTKFEKWYQNKSQKMRYNKSMKNLSNAVVEFTEERDWDQFHSPENLAKSIAIEAGELLECFQWGNVANKSEICDELADVMNYCILLANKLDVSIEDIVYKKLEKIVRNIQ